MARPRGPRCAPAAQGLLAPLLGAALLTRCGGREVMEKTPTPCKAKYDEDFIRSAAERYIKSVPADQQAPHMLLLLGGSGAGKGTFVKLLGEHGFPVKDYAMHGIDDYLEMLPEWVETAADKQNVYKDAADGCYGGAIPIAKAAQNMIIERKMNAIYEETGKNLQRVLDRVVPPFEKAGYRITIALVDSTPEIAKQRAEGRFQAEGRYAPPEYVEGTFKNVFENYRALREKEFVAEALYCDNGCTSVGCMRCWDDSVQAKSGSASVAPKGALTEGPALYMKGRVPKSSREEM